jgi:hypothetical protein
MTWANQFNQEKQNQINWWSAENISNAADWENFTPVGQSDYDIKINDNLLNEDNFIKYWSKKKINNFAKDADIDKDGNYYYIGRGITTFFFTVKFDPIYIYFLGVGKI